MKKISLFLLSFIILLGLSLTHCTPFPVLPQPPGEEEEAHETEEPGSGEEEPEEGSLPGECNGDPEEPEPEPEPEPETEPPDLEALNVDEAILLFSFLSSPIQGARVSSVDGQLPNAPRNYRNGVHQGLDYYRVQRGTPVLAAAEGEVVRADHDYVEMTLEEYDEVIRISMEAEITPEEMLDKLRGRQVWILHQQGIITRYAHLESIYEEIREGERVEKGQVIGTVGDSGTKSAVVGRTLSGSSAPHLHFEIWLGDRFLGQGMEAEAVRRIYTEVFKD